MYQTTLNCFTESSHAIPIAVVLEQGYSQWLQKQPTPVKNWMIANDRKGKAGEISLFSNSQGELENVVIVIENAADWHAVGALPLQLPEKNYHFLVEFEKAELAKFALMWALGAYQFTRYKKAKRESALLQWPKNVDQAEVINTAQAIYKVRDLINTPSYDMMPGQLAAAVREIAAAADAEFDEIIGEDLLKQNYPCIYHVGKGSAYAPRYIQLRWGNPEHPKVTLVGKGVCFDTGGLDIKPSAGMASMKKDMGGAAHVIGLAQLIMAQQLPIHLRVLIPAVDNAVSGNAYRPGDVLTSRAGLTIEVGNTDAEGRLILCDALADAIAEKPDLLIDFATLTGAARVAVGTEIAAFFTNEQALAEKVMNHSEKQHDPCWQLPLYEAYRSLFKSSIADMSNCAESSYGGAITAALFLQAFVPDTQAWMHFDIMASNSEAKPARPKGGEAMGLRAVYSMLKERYLK